MTEKSNHSIPRLNPLLFLLLWSISYGLAWSFAWNWLLQRLYILHPVSFRGKEGIINVNDVLYGRV